MLGRRSGKRLFPGNEPRISNRYKTTFSLPLRSNAAATVLVRNTGINPPLERSRSIRIA
jgi:hypothetical protein